MDQMEESLRRRSKKTFPAKYLLAAECFAFLKKLRFPESPKCCGVSAVWRAGSGIWRCAKCQRRFYVTTGTIFAKCGPARILKWFRAIWLVTDHKYGVSARELQIELGLGYATAFAWRQRIRNLMTQEQPLAGRITLEIVPLPRVVRPGQARRHLILIALQPEDSRCHHYQIRLARPADGSASSVAEAVRSLAEAGSRLDTTQWNGFAGLRDLGYDHRVEDRSTSLETTMTDEAQDVGRDLENLIRRTFKGAIREVNPYLKEFAFRHNHHGDLFQTVLELAA